MEQKQLNPSIEAEVDAVRTLFTDTVSDQLAIFLSDPETMERAAELFSFLIEIQDKLTTLARIYPLYRGNRFQKLPDILQKNASEIKTDLQTPTLDKLQQLIESFLSLTTQHCIQIETMIAHQSLEVEPATITEKTAVRRKLFSETSDLQSVDITPYAYATTTVIENRTASLPTRQSSLKAQDEFMLFLTAFKQHVDRMIENTIDQTTTGRFHLDEKIFDDYAIFFKTYEEISKILLSPNSLKNDLMIEHRISQALHEKIDQLKPENFIEITVERAITLIQEILTLLQAIEPSTNNSSPKIGKKKAFSFKITPKQQMKNQDLFTKLDEALIIFTRTHDSLLKKPTTIERFEALPETIQVDIYSLNSDFCGFCINARKIIDAIQILSATHPETTQSILTYHVDQWCALFTDRTQIIQKMEALDLGKWLEEEIAFFVDFLMKLESCHEALTIAVNQANHKLTTTINPTDSIIPQRIYYFRFFDSPTQDKTTAFYAASRSETNFKHLAHFYLICKDWSIPARLVKHLPENHINFILWWTLQLATNEEKNRLYSGRGGGLAVTTDPLPCERIFNEPGNDTKITKFFTVRRVVTASSVIADATASTAPSLPAQSPLITDQSESCPPRQNF